MHFLSVFSLPITWVHCYSLSVKMLVHSLLSKRNSNSHMGKVTMFSSTINRFIFTL